MPGLEHWRSTFAKVGWMIPPYVAMGFLSRLAGYIEKNSDNFSDHDFESQLSLIHSPENLAAMVEHRYPDIAIVQDFKSTIAEAIEAHFLRLDHVAVAGLIPTIEGIGHRLAKQQGISSRSKDIHPILLKLANKCQTDSLNNRVGASDEIASMMASFSDFTNAILFNSSRRSTRDRANRHAILHGEFADKDYGAPIVFYKIITTIDFLTFMSSFWNGGSFLSPSPTAQSQVRAAYYRYLGTLADLRKEHLPLSTQSKSPHHA